MFDWNLLLENIHVQRAVIILFSFAFLFFLGKIVKVSLSFIIRKIVLIIAITLSCFGIATYVMGVI